MPEADILEFKRPEPEEGLVECGWCKKLMHRHNPGNRPCFCKYECGAAAQPLHTAIGRVREGEGGVRC